MTSRRAKAYGQLIAALERMGPAKLHSDEDDLIREAADTLLFVEEPDDREATATMARAVGLVHQMVGAGRLESGPAGEIIDHLEAVGPPGLGATALRR